MIWKTAWKNVWRNRVRSFVVISSVTVGVFASVFSMAFMNGMIAQRIDAALNEEISHIQITGKEFRLNDDPHVTIGNLEEVRETLNQQEGVESFTGRKLIGGMAASATKSTGVIITGIDPEQERKMFSISEEVIPITGTFFETTSRNDQAVIGQDLAKELNVIRYSVDTAGISNLLAAGVPQPVLQRVNSLTGKRFQNEKSFTRALKEVLSSQEVIKYGQKIKDEAWTYREGAAITMTFIDSTGNQVGSRFRIAGIYDVKNTAFETSVVFVRNSDLSRLSGFSEESFNQMIVRLSNTDETEAITTSLREKMPQFEILNWKDLQPDLAMMTDYVYQMYGFYMVIILAALAFGIVNTMLMAVLERTKELGMLAAIGMNRRKIFSMIMLESVFLSVIGGAAGMVVGKVIIDLSAKNGINFAQYAEGMEAYGYSAHVFPELSIGFYVMGSILIILTGILSSVYPALKALKLNPVEAIRTE